MVPVKGSVSAGPWAVKIALRPPMRLPLGCTLAACLTGDRRCVGVLVRRWWSGRRSRLVDLV